MPVFQLRHSSKLRWTKGNKTSGQSGSTRGWLTTAYVFCPEWSVYLLPGKFPVKYVFVPLRLFVRRSLSVGGWSSLRFPVVQLHAPVRFITGTTRLE